MVLWRKNLWALAVGVALSGSSYTMLIPFLPLYLLDIGVDSAEVNLWSGLLFSVTFLVAAIMAPYWGRRADKTGKRRMVLRAGFCLAIVYFMGAFVRGPIDLLIVRILQGFANGFVPAAMAIVAGTTPRDKLGSSMGVMQTALLCGGIIGPLLGGFLSHFFGMRMSFVIAAVIIFLDTLSVAFLVTEPSMSKAPSGGTILDDLKTAVSNRRLLKVLALLLLVQMVTMVLQPLLTLYVVELQGSLSGAVLTSGIVYSLAGIAGAIAAPTWGKIGQRSGFLRVLFLTFCGAGLFNASQFFAATIYQFACLQFLFGLFVVGVFPAINTIAVTSAPKEFQGRIFGLTTTANQLGSMLGPLVGGFLSSLVGIRPVFLFTGALLFTIGLAVAWRYFRRKVAVNSGV
ncbi:MAG: MFS transporter [Sporomusaceae bacterium]|nr:MFS transporter [Sporomusaceae bacterium]